MSKPFPGPDGWTPEPFDGNELPSRPQPSLGRRSDGVALFYAEKVNYLAGAAEAGKTWLVLVVAVEQMRLGAGVVFIDLEDDEASVRSMLAVLGLPLAVQRELFVYLQPKLAPTENSVQQLMESLAFTPDLVVVDGMTEMMSLQGLNPSDMTDVATTFRFFRLFSDAGSGVVVLDHLRKGDPGGLYPIGSQHKRSAVTGSFLVMRNRQRFGEGRAGVSDLLVAKDRPGSLRRHEIAVGDDDLIAQMVVHVDREGGSNFDLHVPGAAQ